MKLVFDQKSLVQPASESSGGSLSSTEDGGQKEKDGNAHVLYRIITYPGRAAGWFSESVGDEM